MVHPVLVIGGIVAAGWAFRQGAGALEEASTATKWAVAGAGLYVSYQALRSAGVLK